MKNFKISATFVAGATTTFLVIVLGVLSAKSIWSVYNYYNMAKAPFSSSPLNQLKNTNAEIKTSAQLVEPIITSEMFGSELKKELIQELDLANLPISSLDVVVRGILLSPNLEDSYCILAVNGGLDKIFRQGDIISDGFAIKSIRKSAIVVTKNGEFELINLPSFSSISTNAPTQTARTKSLFGLKRIRSEILQNPALLNDHITFSPYTKNNQMIGYTVKAGRNPQFFDTIGLQAGDVVISLDGVNVAELLGRFDILNELYSSDNVRIGILRNNQKQIIKVDFSK